MLGVLFVVLERREESLSAVRSETDSARSALLAMAKEHIKIVVWDSIGNTGLGLRPSSVGMRKQVEHFLREDPAQTARARSFDELFADYDVELIWFNSADEAFLRLRHAGRRLPRQSAPDQGCR